MLSRATYFWPVQPPFTICWVCGSLTTSLYFHRGSWRVIMSMDTRGLFCLKMCYCAPPPLCVKRCISPLLTMLLLSNQSKSATATSKISSTGRVSLHLHLTSLWYLDNQLQVNIEIMILWITLSEYWDCLHIPMQVVHKLNSNSNTF